MPKFENMSDEELNFALAQKRAFESLPDDKLDELLAEKRAYEAKAKEQLGPSKGESALQGFGQGATGGYLAQLQAATEPLTFAALNAITGKDVESDPTYLGRRDQYLKKLEQEQAANPKSFMAGQLGGAITQAALIGKALPTSATSGMGRVFQETAKGAALGAVQNPGDTEGQLQPLQLGDRLGNAALGGITGGAFQGATEGLKFGVDKLAKLKEILKAKAAERAVKSTGIQLRDARKLGDKKQIEDYGRFLIDKKLIKPGDSYEDIYNSAKQLEKSSGEKIGEIIKKASDQELASSKQSISRQKLALNSIKELLGDESIPGIKEQNEQLKSLAKQLTGKVSLVEGKEVVEPFEDLTIAEVQKLKTTLGKQKDNPFIKWKRLPTDDIPIKEQFYRKMYSSLSDELENAVHNMASEGDESMKKAYLEAKKEYGASKFAAKVAEDQEKRQLANRFISPSDYAFGGLGGLASGAYGDPNDDLLTRGLKGAAGFAAGSLGNKALRLYGNPLAASFLDKASEGLPAKAIQSGAQKLAPYLEGLRNNKTLNEGLSTYATQKKSDFLKEQKKAQLQEYLKSKADKNKESTAITDTYISPDQAGKAMLKK